MNESFSSLIDSASSISIILPQKPSFDQVAAGLCLFLSITGRKSVNISCSSPITVGFNRLIGVNKIGTEAGDKNLSITFQNYDAGNIEKVSYDIDNGQFKLTVVPKTGFNSPQKDQIVLGYSGGSADFAVLIGGVSESDFPSLSEKVSEGTRIVHIGTRVLSSDRAIMSFAKPSSSVSEVVASLIKENELPMDIDVATNLVMGIEEGSGNFSSNEVTPDTFEIFAYLLRNGGQRQPKVKLSPISFPAGSIPTQPYTQVPRGASGQVAEQVEQKEELVENPPTDWLQPKVFKGTSVS